MGLAGRVFRAERVLTPAAVRAFAELTGDANPLHCDPAAAAQCGFAGPIVPGMLAASLFAALIGSHLPGAVYLSQELRFRAAVPVGDRVTVEVAVETERELRGRRRLQLGTSVRRGDGLLAVEGRAEVLL